MKTWFADANVFLRFFTRDDTAQADAARRLLEKASAGQIRLVVAPPVLFEIAWRLRAAYKQPREKVIEALRAIVAMPGIRLSDKHLVEDALARAEESGVEFADAYIMSASADEKCDGIATFDRSDFGKLGAKLIDL